MRYLSFYSLLVVSSFFPSLVNALESELFTLADSFSYSEVAPIKQLSNSLEGDRIERGEVAFTSNIVSLGQRFYFQDSAVVFHYSVFTRVDYLLEFTHDTALMIYAKENDVPLADDREHDILLKINHSESRGFSIGVADVVFSNVFYRLNISHLKAQQMMYGQIDGSLTSFDSDAQGRLDVDYHYSEDILFDREPSDQTATGFSLDLYLAWQPIESLTIEFDSRDLTSRITWDDQQNTVGSATTARVYVDGNGETQVRSALSWKESHSRIKQKMPRQIRTTSHWQFSLKNAVFLQRLRHSNETFHRLGYSRKFPLSMEARIFYDFNLDAFAFNLESRYLSFGFILDETDFDEAKVLGFNLSINAPISF